jgi:hypothetical protein
MSVDNAWAVGHSGGAPLVLHWNGAAWKQVPSPVTKGTLEAVAAATPSSIWAVGVTGVGDTLIMHWNGTAWKRLPSPSPDANMGFDDILLGAVALSADNAWTAGFISCGCGPGTSLIEHWNGTAWKRLPSPTPGGGVIARAMAAVSARDVWAVGETGNGDSLTKTLTMRWNGTAWKQVPSPNPAASDSLSGVAATSASYAWAVGSSSNRSRNVFMTLILHWNGTAWK